MTRRKAYIMKKYTLRLNDKHCIEISKPISTLLVYKIPYKNVKAKDHNVDISNRFIVYILFGKNASGKDIVYVGKSKNGIDNRPTSHEDKNADWTDCYVLTDIKERTILNDGTIQYLEDKICNRINDIKQYINTTVQTTSGTANHSDMEDCEEYLQEAYDMLYTLGLDLITPNPTIAPTNSSDADDTDDNQPIHTIKTKMITLYNELVTAVTELNTDIVFTPMKHYIKATIEQDHLFDVKSNTDKLGIYFNAKKGTLIDENNLLEDISTIGHLGNGDYRIMISDNSKIPEIIDFINQVINL